MLPLRAIVKLFEAKAPPERKPERRIVNGKDMILKGPDHGLMLPKKNAADSTEPDIFDHSEAPWNVQDAETQAYLQSKGFFN